MMGESLFQAARTIDINGFTMEEVGLALRHAVEGSHLKIGEVARHVEQATFGSEDVHSPDERPDVFQLPVPTRGPEEARLIAELKSGDNDITKMRKTFAATVRQSGQQSWIFLTIVALNFLWCGNSAAAGVGRCPKSRPSVAQCQVLRRVEQGVDRFLGDGCRVPCTDWGKFLDLKISKYDAGPVVKGVPLTWEQMKTGLPAPGVAGRASALSISPARHWSRSCATRAVP
jgi:hypothetical protein